MTQSAADGVAHLGHFLGHHSFDAGQLLRLQGHGKAVHLEVVQLAVAQDAILCSTCLPQDGAGPDEPSDMCSCVLDKCSMSVILIPIRPLDIPPHL